MGLDMYLYRRHYLQNWTHNGSPWQVTVTYMGEPLPEAHLDPAKIIGVTEQVGYWRKANQIHAWFVRNVQDGRDECQVAEVQEGQLAELLRAVREVLAAHQAQPRSHAKAMELLPPPDGFFFGSTALDEHYYEDLRSTEAILAPLFEAGASSDDRGRSFETFEYRSSW